MLINDRKTIGVYISQVDEAYQSLICKGIMRKAKMLNYNVLFFTNYGNSFADTYNIGENSIAYLADNATCFDGIIVVSESFQNEGLASQIYREIRKNATCPIVSIEKKVGDFYNILVDKSTQIEAIMEHLITHHQLTRINYVSGPKGYQESETRFASYKKVLEAHNLPIEEERIFFGTYQKNVGQTALAYFIQSSGTYPEAIVCANDAIAIFVCDALVDYGLSVPEDVIVTGCDGTPASFEYNPSITTSRLPIHEMGETAVDRIHQILLGENIARDTYVKSVPLFRGSCNCYCSESNDYHIKIQKPSKVFEVAKNALSSNAYMSTDLNGITDMDTLLDKIRVYVRKIKDFSEFYLCLCTDWQAKAVEGEADAGKINPASVSRFSDMMQMVLGETPLTSYHTVSFPREQLLPTQYLSPNSQFFFFFPVHYLETVYGYAAVSFRKFEEFSIAFQGWLINVSNALENLRINLKMNNLIYKLEDMYVRDALTGLHNRRGLELFGQRYYRNCLVQHWSMFVLCLDMDGLKFINDKFGHVHGDTAIKTIGDALRMTFCDDEICSRSGGDEFVIIGADYSETRATEAVASFLDTLSKCSDALNAPYNVRVSYGFCVSVPDENHTLEYYTNIADAAMYEQKMKKKAEGDQYIR